MIDYFVSKFVSIWHFLSTNFYFLFDIKIIAPIFASIIALITLYYKVFSQPPKVSKNNDDNNLYVNNCTNQTISIEKIICKGCRVKIIDQLEWMMLFSGEKIDLGKKEIPTNDLSLRPGETQNLLLRVNGAYNYIPAIKRISLLCPTRYKIIIRPIKR